MLNRIRFNTKNMIIIILVLEVLKYREIIKQILIPILTVIIMDNTPTSPLIPITIEVTTKMKCQE